MSQSPPANGSPSNVVAPSRVTVRCTPATPILAAFQVTSAWVVPVFVLGVGNDAQYAKFCDFAGRPELATDERFRTNADRVKNRAVLFPILEEITRSRPQSAWVKGLSKLGVPAGPVNSIDQVFADPHVQARGMRIEIPREGVKGGSVPLIGNPIRFSETPVEYGDPPPRLGEHTEEVLSTILDLSPEEIAGLRARSVI